MQSNARSLGAIVALALAIPASAQETGESGEFSRRLEEVERELEALKELKPDDPSTLRAYWKDGLRLDSADKKIRLKFGGRIQVDTAFFSEDSEIENTIGQSEDGVEFRRARLFVEGLLYDHFKFRAQYDFAGGRESGDSQGTDFKDAYVALVNAPTVGNVRVGQYKEPFGLEQLTSSKYITFLERGLPDIFTPARNVGVMTYNNLCEERAYYAVGVFRDTDNFGDSAADGKYDVTLRLTGLPIYEEDGHKLLHIGGAYTFRNPEGSSARFRSRPEAHLANRYVDTGNIRTNDINQFVAEAAFICEQFSLQSEFMLASLNTIDGQADPEFWGWYIYASYFLTEGDHRVYRTSYAAFDKVRPQQSFLDGEGGLGAWELAARYSTLDLEDAGITGGVLHDLTAGVNWYWNTNFRWMFNYVFSHTEGSGDAHIVMMRFQAFW